MDQIKIGKFIAVLRKEKGLRDNAWLIAVSVTVGIAASVKLSFDQLWVLISPFWLVVFSWLRNRMMAYVESRV